MTIQDNFEVFHRDNPHVYEMMRFYVKELLRAGHKRISPRFVMERIRWEMMLPTSGSGWHVARGKPFKINNNFSSRYARLLISEHPAIEKFIETRELKSP